MKLHIRLFIIASLVVSLPACSKHEDAPVITKGSSISEVDLAQRIPASSAAFIVWNTDSDAYRRFKASSWGSAGNTNLVKMLEQAQATGKADAIKPFVDVLIKTGLITTNPQQPEVIRSGIAFVDAAPNSGTKPGLGLYLSANSGSNLKEKLAQIQAVFQSEGYQVTKRAGAPDGFNVAIKAKDAGAPEIGTVSFVANEATMAVATQDTLIDRAFAANPDNGMKVVTAGAGYQKTVGSLPSGNQLSLGFVDVKALLARIRSSVPADAVKDLDMALQTVPVQEVGFAHSFDKGLSDSFAAHVVAQNDQQKRWLGAIATGSTHETLAQVPADSVAALSIDGTSLNKIKNLVFAEMPTPEMEALRTQLAPFDSLNNLTVAVRGPGAMGAFPELLFVAGGSDPAKVQESVKAAVDQALMSFGLQLGGWQSKSVEGGTMNFLMSPLGVGAFTAQSGNSVVIGTSEASVVDSLKASSGGTKSLKATLASAQDTSKTPSLLAVYANFERMTDVAKSVQGSLSMFTGGKTGMTDESLEQFRKLGVFSGRLAYNDDLLRFDSRYEEAPKS